MSKKLIAVKCGKHSFEVKPDGLYNTEIMKEGSDPFRVTVREGTLNLTQPAYMTNVATKKEAETLCEQLEQAIDDAQAEANKRA